MSKVRLNDEEWQKPDPRFIPRAGGRGKVMAVIGMDSQVMPKSEKRVIELQCLILRDLDPDGDPKKFNPVNDEGMAVRLKLWCTDFGRRHGLIPLMRAQQWPADRELDEENDADIAELIRKPFIATVEHSESKGRIYAEVTGKSIRTFEGDEDPEWKELRNAAAEKYEEELDARAKRREAGSSYSPKPNEPF